MREPIDSFAIDWYNPFDDFAQAKVFKSRVDEPSSFLKALFDLVESKRGRPSGAILQDLYWSDLELSGEWKFERPLGKGSFGVTALYKRYQFGNPIDEVVVKDARQGPDDLVDRRRPNLSREALVMAQTNALESESFSRLRNYKFLINTQQYRYFFQNYGYGDLELLRLKYKAWQIYAPELFLWHMFSCFAKGHALMANGQFRSLEKSNFGVRLKDGYLYHSDIKDSNVFLGAPTEDEGILSWYPSPRIADFGLSKVLSSTNSRNRARHLQHGTPQWYPPEIRFREVSASVRWLFDERRDPRADPSAHAITSQANLFPLAAIIWSFMTGREIIDLYDMIYRKISSHNPFSGDPSIDPSIKLPGKTLQTDYSESLRSLVRDCLKMLPQDRPSPTEVLQRVEMGTRRHMEREHANLNFDEKGALRRLRLFYNENEINDAPRRDGNFQLDNDFWIKFAAATLFIPEEWGALLPPTAPSNWQPAPAWPAEVRRRWMANLKEARAAKRPREAESEDSEPLAKRPAPRDPWYNIWKRVPSFKRVSAVQESVLHAAPPELAEAPSNVIPEDLDSSSGDHMRRPALGGNVPLSEKPWPIEGGMVFQAKTGRQGPPGITYHQPTAAGQNMGHFQAVPDANRYNLRQRAPSLHRPLVQEAASNSFEPGDDQVPIWMNQQQDYGSPPQSNDVIRRQARVRKGRPNRRNGID